jgi:hypothetical protein
VYVMLLGNEVVYQVGLLDDGYWELLLGVPVLSFIGYQIAHAMTRKKQPITPVVVLPLDHEWEAYTSNPRIIDDITNAVITMRKQNNYDRSLPITYPMFRSYLRMPEADAVAQTIPEYGVFRYETP